MDRNYRNLYEDDVDFSALAEQDADFEKQYEAFRPRP